MSTALVQHTGRLPEFNGVKFEIIDHEGGRWVTVTQLAKALEYEDAAGLRKLIKRNGSEFTNKISRVKLTPLDLQENMIINYHGVIRAAMLSDAPRAIEFRDWAEDVLFKVMTQGNYMTPHFAAAFMENMEAMQKSMMEIVEANAHATAALTNRIDQLEERQTRLLLPSEPDISAWPTASLRTRTLLHPQKPPKGWNTGGAFDRYAADRHNQKVGGYPRSRSRRFIGKSPEFVYPICTETDQFLRETYRIYIRCHWPMKQRSLKLVAMKRARS